MVMRYKNLQTQNSFLQSSAVKHMYYLTTSSSWTEMCMVPRFEVRGPLHV